ncbi:MAG: hypothetical protein ACLRZ2_06205 [Veillonella sp.]
MIGLQVTENYLLFPRKSVTAIIGLMPANEDIKTKRAVHLVHNKLCISKITRKATVNNKMGEEAGSKTTADISGIAMKGQPIQ